MVAHPTASSDIVCGPCEDGTYQDEVGLEECKPVVQCDTASQFEAIPPTASTNAQCASLTECQASEVSSLQISESVSTCMRERMCVCFVSGW